MAVATWLPDAGDDCFVSDDRPETSLARAKREYLEALAAVKMLENGLDPDNYVYEVGKPLRRKERADV